MCYYNLTEANNTPRYYHEDTRLHITTHRHGTKPSPSSNRNGDHLMFKQLATKYTVDAIYAAVKANNTTALDAARESQYQRQLFSNWCRKLGARAYP